MKRMLYFQTGADDVTAFPADWIYAIDAASTAVEVYFTGTGESTLLSSVGLTVTAGQEENVVKAIIQTINSGPHSDGVIVIADDANSVYCHSGITACGTITFDTTP
jgi:hypothetical protein